MCEVAELWEVWRRLNKHFEAGVAAREAGVRQAFGNMNNKKSKNPGETQSLMVDLEEKAKKYVEVTGGEPDEEWHKQVLMGFIDQTTNNHTMMYQREPLAEYIMKIDEFITAYLANEKKTASQTNRLGGWDGWPWWNGDQ